MNLHIRTLRPRRGLTIIELTIAMAINLLGITAIFSVFIASSKMVGEFYFQNKAAMAARSAIDKLTSDARMAITVEPSFSSYTANANTLILRVPSIDASGFPINTATTFDRIIYHKAPSSTSKLMRTVIVDGASARKAEQRVIADSVTPGIYATQPDPIGQYVIYYQFTAEQKWRQKSIKVSAGGSVQLRNHV